MTVPQHVLVSRLVRLANDLHANGRADTAARRYAAGVIRREAANDILRALEFPTLDYDGRVAAKPYNPTLEGISSL